MSTSLLRKGLLGVLLVLSLGSLGRAAEDAQFKTVAGLAVYLGVVPAAIVKGHPSGHAEQTMHGGMPVGRMRVSLCRCRV
jgi:hypothetical protein